LKILVTGALGAVGLPLVNGLRARGFDVWLADRPHYNDEQYIRCDVGEYRQVERLFKDREYDLVYHLAGEFGRNNGEDYYESLWKTNAVGTKNLLRFQEQLKFRIVFTSSSEIYGDYPGVMSEDVPDKTPIRQLNDYAISKWVNELQILNSADRFGTEIVRLRLFNLYGPGEWYSDYRSVVCLFIYRALHKLPFMVYAKHHRTFCFVDDAVRSMCQLATKFQPGEVYNIAGDEYVSMKEVSDTILAQLGMDDSLVKYVDIEEHNTVDKRSDASKAREQLGHKNTCTLMEGIKRTISWQREVYRV
jgi:dTDP-glucose 4,6-dehydratase